MIKQSCYWKVLKTLGQGLVLFMYYSFYPSKTHFSLLCLSSVSHSHSHSFTFSYKCFLAIIALNNCSQILKAHIFPCNFVICFTIIPNLNTEFHLPLSGGHSKDKHTHKGDEDGGERCPSILNEFSGNLMTSVN